MPGPAAPHKVGLWKPSALSLTPTRVRTSAEPRRTATGNSVSARLLPEHFSDPSLSSFLTRARARTNVLVAEGDSWFDYPAPFRIDLIDELDNLGREIISIAYRGDTVENMVYGTQGTDGNLVEPDLTRLVRLVSEVQPKAVLFSGGGNDVAGPEFAGFLNHIRASSEPIRRDFLRFFIHDYVKAAYEKTIREIWTVNEHVKFITHGYANALPTGEGVGNLFGSINFVGPWLKPAIDAKGYDPVRGAAIIRDVLGEFNTMLGSLAAAHPQKFIHVDFRSHIGNHYEDWANELHLTNAGIRVAALVFNQAITDAIV